MRRKPRIAITVTALICLAGVAATGNRLLELFTAYAAKTMCSAVFVSGRDAHEVREREFVPDGDPLFTLASWFEPSLEVERDRGRVEAHFLGRFAREARHAPGFGCTLTHAGVTVPPRPPGAPRRPTQMPAPMPPRPDERLDDLLDWAFDEPPEGPPRRTRAVVVMHRGSIVAERYAAPFNADMPLRGWSMTKSVMNALVGRLVHEGRLDLDSPAEVPAWADTANSSSVVTFRHLLTMSAGNEFDETNLNPFSNVIQMLLFEPSAGEYAAGAGKPGALGRRWRYASADTNVLSLAVRRHLGNDETYWSWPRRSLFDPLGMSSAVMERDAAGTFVGSSFMLATARDWARFGQLYAQDGIWNGERLLPEGWVEMSRTPGAGNARGIYGAHFWLNAQPSSQGANAAADGLEDALHAVGHDGQFLSVVPSRELVAVRLGLTRNPDGWSQSEFLQRILETIGD